MMPTGVALRSLDRFLGGNDSIVVLHLGLSKEDVRNLKACVRHAHFRVIDCAGRVRPSWVPPQHVSEAAFLRYLIPELLPDAERAVYMDGDVIVRRDPKPLHDADLAGSTLGAVRSRVAPFAASPGGIAAWLEAGIPSTAPYFNSGVLVMDLERWRSRQVTDRLTDYLHTYGARVYLADQEALNAAVVGDWTQLDRSWNYVTHVAESFLQQPELEPSNPSVVHFAGRLKPWIYGRAPLFAEDWYEVLTMTPWAGFVPVPPPQPRGPRAAISRSVGGILSALRRLSSESTRP